MSVLKELLAQAVAMGASDIHIKSGAQPRLRISGTLAHIEAEPLGDEDMLRIASAILPVYLREPFKATHEADFSLLEEDVGRFRVNVFNAQGVPTIALRHVKTQIPTFEQLRLPLNLKSLARMERGIVLLSGTTGSGKSTTLAAVIGEMNRLFSRRIITIEDPVEYVFQDENSMITQREVGLDTLSFSNALEHVVRQDPDVILIGEIRSRDTLQTALLAAETGHVVLTTLHSGTARLAVPRILDMFPADEQNQIRLGLSRTLHAVICQRLLPDISGAMIPAVEILMNTPTVQKLLEKGELDLIEAAIETGREDGMQTFNQAIYDLIQEGTISEEEGMRFATNPESLRMNLQGIFLDEGRRILNV